MRKQSSSNAMIGHSHAHEADGKLSCSQNDNTTDPTCVSHGAEMKVSKGTKGLAKYNKIDTPSLFVQMLIMCCFCSLGGKPS